MRLTAQFKVLFTKEFGDKIDLIRFSNDSAYAKQWLVRASASENETLLVIAMQLMQSRGLITKQEKDLQGADEKIRDKYTGRLR
jgi:hypothetical protein